MYQKLLQSGIELNPLYLTVNERVTTTLRISDYMHVCEKIYEPVHACGAAVDANPWWPFGICSPL